MDIIGIICEYNPMHSGHVYQINRIKKQYPNAYIIALCSGSFIQRGEPSFMSKHSKSIIAVKNGIDLFLEMPTIISIQSANYFSFYSVSLLNKLNILTKLSFGLEKIGPMDLESYYDFNVKNKQAISFLAKKYLDKGLSYKKSMTQSLIDLGFEKAPIFDKANNTLGLQYYTALKKLNSDIDIFTIDRKGSSYHDCDINEYDHQSATALRQAIIEGKNIDKYLAFAKKEYENMINQLSLNDLSYIFYYKAFVEEFDPSNIVSYENGILQLLKSNFNGNLREMIDRSHNKRYSKSRLQRFVLNYLLEITTGDINNLKYLNYIRPLGFNVKGRELLTLIKDKSNIKIINKLTNKVDLDRINQRFLEIDEKSFRLYNLFNQTNNILDFSHIPFID